MRTYNQSIHNADTISYEVNNVIAEGKSIFQEYLFFNSPLHGVCVSLDGDLQSAQKDEALYHEALVHPAMMLHPNPQTVLIMGGGEGATAREVLRHKSVKRVVMVDIDREFVDLCKQHIPSWSEGAFSDLRLELLHMDINEYLLSCEEKFDVVIGDLIDVNDWESEVAFLYGEALYSQIKKHLNKNAIVATQGGTLDMQELKNHKIIRTMMEKLFGSVASYGVVIPSFYSLWGFVIAGDMQSFTNAEVSKKFTEHTFEPLALGSDALGAAFSLSNRVKKNIGV